MKNKQIFVSIAIIILIFLILVVRQNKTDKVSKSSLDANTINSSVESNKESYNFVGNIPKESVRIEDYFKDDHRSMSVFLFDNRLNIEDNNKLVIAKGSINEYEFYSNLELLSALILKEKNLFEYKEKQLQTSNGEIKKLFYFYEKVSDGIIYREYSFNYGEIDYLISVKMLESKSDEYDILTKELLSTMIPHTMTPEYAEKILGIN
jgi:hypothetical protein